MKIALINPVHTAIGSRVPGEHLPPLGLLSIGGPLLDHGHDVVLIDADREMLANREIVARIHAVKPEVVLIGHSGSSSVHKTVVKLSRLLKQQVNGITIVYGGVYPSYLWDEILTGEASIDLIVRGEGEKTVVSLIQALSTNASLYEVDGIAFRDGSRVVGTTPAKVIHNLDDYRVGWELIDHSDYSYWGGKRAVVAQFSRGCTHACSYCGQRGFWGAWRHRDPITFAKELARLYRERGVELINFADELPTGSQTTWKAFLEALIAENVPLLLVGSTRASDIVRDRDILHLYKKAGVIRFLLGIESYDETTLKEIRKGGSTAQDKLAIELLRKHNIVAMATYVLGFSEESDRDYWRSFQHLRDYDPDQIQLLYATPHRWTEFYEVAHDRKVIETDINRWDYKHQVLAAPNVPAWRVFFWFKLVEVLLQLRPKVLARLLFHPDSDYRHAMRWYTRIGRRVWFKEVLEFLFNTNILKHGPTLKEFSGESLVSRGYAHQSSTSAITGTTTALLVTPGPRSSTRS